MHAHAAVHAFSADSPAPPLHAQCLRPIKGKPEAAGFRYIYIVTLYYLFGFIKKVIIQELN